MVPPAPSFACLRQSLCLVALFLLIRTSLIQRSHPSRTSHVVFIHYAAPELHFGSDLRLLDLMRISRHVGKEVAFLSRARGPSINQRALRKVVGSNSYVVRSHQLTQLHPLIRGLRRSQTTVTFFIPVWFWEGSLPTIFEEYVPVLRRLLPLSTVVALSDDCHSRREKLLAYSLRTDERPEFYASSLPPPVWFEEKERAIFSAADLVTFITEQDAHSCSSLVPPHVHHTLLRTGPRQGDVVARISHVGRDGLMFLGNGLNPTNFLAIRQFLTQVWPVFRAEEPSMKIYLVGQDSKEAMPCKQHGMLCGWTWRTSYYGFEQANNIVITGFITPLETILKHSLAMIVPIAVSTGVNTKIFEALRYGLPVISSPLPLSSLDLDGSCCNVCGAENATCWLLAVRSLRDPSAWVKASAASISTGHELFVDAHQMHDFVRILDTSWKYVLNGGTGNQSLG